MPNKISLIRDLLLMYFIIVIAIYSNWNEGGWFIHISITIFKIFFLYFQLSYSLVFFLVITKMMKDQTDEYIL